MRPLIRSTLCRVTAVVISCVALAACSEGADAGPPSGTTVAATPDQAPSVSRAASASPSPTAQKPERPAAMDRDDGEGAAAAAEYFIELYPYIMATGDTAEFEAMSHEECGFCSQSLGDARRLMKLDQRYIGGKSSSHILDTYEQDGLTGIYPFDVQVVQEVSTIEDLDGNVVSSLEASKSRLRIEVGREDTDWIIVEVASAPKEAR